MNVQGYIASGILELYVSGALSEKEMVEVSAMIKRYPEIRQEVEDIEQTLLTFFANQSNKDKSANLKENILKKITTEIQKEDINKDTEKKDTKVIPIQQTEPKTEKRLLLVAASIGLLLCSLFGNFLLYTSLKNAQKSLAETQKRLTALEAESIRIAENASFYEKKYSEIRTYFKAIRDSQFKTIALTGQKISPNSKAVVYWNAEKQTVFIDANQLPPPPPNKVYQLWSLKLEPLTPKDAGIIEGYVLGEDNFFQLKNVANAEAFAITLEPAGGNINPTLEQLYVMGKL